MNRRVLSGRNSATPCLSWFLIRRGFVLLRRWVWAKEKLGRLCISGREHWACTSGITALCIREQQALCILWGFPRIMCYLGLHFVTAKMKGALEKKKERWKGTFLARLYQGWTPPCCTRKYFSCSQLFWAVGLESGLEVYSWCARIQL